MRIGDPGQEQRGDQRHAAGQPVQPVDEVHRVGGEQQPQHGQRRRQPGQRQGRDIGHPVVVHVQPAADRDQRRQHLGAELHGERPVEQVVEEGDGGDGHRRLDHPQEVRIRQPGELGELVEDADPDQEGQHDAHAAALRGGLVMRLAAGIRVVQQPGGDHQPHRRGRQQSQPDGEGQVAQQGVQGHRRRSVSRADRPVSRSAAGGSRRSEHVAAPCDAASAHDVDQRLQIRLRDQQIDRTAAVLGTRGGRAARPVHPVLVLLQQPGFPPPGCRRLAPWPRARARRPRLVAPRFRRGARRSSCSRSPSHRAGTARCRPHAAARKRW